MVKHRPGHDDLVAAGRLGGEQVALRADGARQRRDQLLADGIEGRVGHLGEQLLEVVVQQPGPLGQDGQRGVGPHGADRLVARLRHGRQEDLEILGGVAEQTLMGNHRRVLRGQGEAGGQLVEVDLLAGEPLRVGVLGGQGGLDLVVGDDAALGGVHQEHPARLQPAPLHDAPRVDIEDAHLGGHDDQTVVGDPVAGGAQSVAVENRPDHGPVGEGDGGRSVPGLHERGVELVERPLGGIHVPVLLPGLGDHHQHGVGQGTPAQVQQLEHLVEAGRVAGARRDDREDPLQVAGQQVAGEQILAGPHPVAVALQGVDLAVVGEVPVRMGRAASSGRCWWRSASAPAPGRFRVARRSDRGKRTRPEAR